METKNISFTNVKGGYQNGTWAKWDFWLFPTSTKETSQASFKLRASKAPELAYQESEGGSG